MAKKWCQPVGIRAALIIVVGSIIVAGINIWHERSGLKIDNEKYKNENSELRQQISQKNSEIQRLETQLTPFKTIAIEKYTGSEQEALRKLANELQELKNFVDPLKKPIASATAQVEVNIKSDEQVSVRYMDAGGYLAFVKNSQSLLLTSNTQSDARQNGKGEVVYDGDFQMRADHSSVGKPIEILQTSDAIQIGFNKIPENSQVVKGKASVVINGDVRYEFEILPQQMQGDKIFIRDIKNKFLTTQSSGL